MAVQKHTRSFKVYRAKKDGTGMAMSISHKGPENDYAFLEVSRQKTTSQKDEHATFDWQNAIRFKLGLNDIGELIATLERRQKGVGGARSEGGFRGLFHQTEQSTTILRFEEGRTPGYYLQINQKRGGSALDSRALSITHGEASLLLVLLRVVVSRIFA